ncbi:unnamed protein product [Orchesella dallaii]|uniref:C2H2-type domain-containing protein n=1 Tax=Orchesella dallaii TaxID=48710 RepID=A0ABP1PM02_9HEXA
MTEESTKIKCIFCSDLVQRIHLSDHIRGHTREKPYLCKDCNSTFASKGSLYQHSERMHNSDSKDMSLPKPTLKCVYCGCEFRNEYYLSWHRRQRIGNHPYACRYCCASFVDEVKLRRHHYSIHKGRILFVRCPDVRVGGNTLPDSDSDAESIEAPTPTKEVDKQPGLQSTSRRMENNEFSPSAEARTPTEVDKQSELQSTSSRMDYNEFLSGRTRIRKPSAVNTFNFSRELFPRRRLNLESTPEPTASPLAGVLNTNVNTDDDIQKMKEDNDYEAEMDVEDIAALNIKMMKDEGHEAEEGAAGNLKKQYCNNKVEDFEDSFVLSVWRTSKKANYLNKLYGQSPMSDKALSYMLNFLRGDTDTSQLSVNELLSLVTQSAVKLVGLFPAALMIIDFAVNKDIQCLVTLYEECSKLDVKLQRIVKTIITLFVQRQFVDGSTELNKLSELPQDLFRVDLMMELRYLRESNTTSELLQSISTPNERKTFSAIMEMLEELVDEDMKNEGRNLQLADTSYSWNERGFIWTRNIRKYVNGILDNDHQPFFNVALRKEMEIERRRGMSENFIFLANTRHNDVTDVFTPLYVHRQAVAILAKDGLCRQVIRRFGEPPGKEEVEAFVIASDEEVDTFLSLLYDSFKPSKYKGKITLAVFQLACKIKVRDNWYFMFRDSNFLDLTDDRNRQSILDILLLMKKYPELDNLARNFTLLFSGEKATKCLNDMHPTLVKSFLDMTTLRVDELLVYKIMMQWSHFEARKPCEDEMKATYDPDVDVEFKRVRSALRLTELTRHFGSICRQDGYITWEDAELAHKFNINKMSAEDVWFSVKPRERPE